MLWGCTQDKPDAPIIPIEDFFRNPVKTAFQLSPDGKYFSYLKPWQNRLNICVESVDGKDTLQITQNASRDIKHYFWANNNRIVYLSDNNADDIYDVFAVNIDGSNSVQLTNYGKSTTKIVDKLENDENHILIAANKRDLKVFDIYKLNINDGSLEMVSQNPGNITNWVTDHNGSLRVAIKSDGVNTTVLYRQNEQKPFKKLFTNNFKDEFIPFFFSYDNKYLYAASNISTDKLVIVKYDPEEKKTIDVVFSHPEVDVERLLASDKEQKITGVSFTTWKREYKFFDDSTKYLYDELHKKLAGYEIVIESKDKSEERMLIRTFSDRSMGAYYFYDLSTNEFKKLADVSPWLHEENMARMKPIRYKSSDGFTIHGYLTLPKGCEPENLPVIIFPHGGPWFRNSWGFDNTAQFFANRGYAVLQMNFRGSTGYGREFFEAGFKQWGGKMQDDIAEGVNWLIRQNIADPERIAIYGASFGGYSALEGLTKNPDLYSCGICYSGIPNLFTFLNSVPAYWKPFRAMLYEMVGNPKTDSLMLHNSSPYYFIDKIKVPVLFAHGAGDTKSDITEIDSIVENLKKRNINVTYMVKENEGHGFRNEENRIELFKKIEKFLAKNLKGRIAK